MLLSVKTLATYTIEAKDGNIGEVHTFLLDDQQWVVRYLVADTGKWLPGRKVLINPSALQKPEKQMDVFPVDLTREQIKNSPDIDVEKPVSRQQEIELHKYYNWGPYWTGAYGPISAPNVPVAPEVNQPKESPITPQALNDEKTNPHLRSTKEIIGYRVHAEDGQIGHVADFIAHIEDWVIRYLVVDTRNWLPGKHVIIPPDWIKEISWSKSEVMVDVSKETIKNSPQFDPTAPVNREYEIRLYDYYGRPRYWL